MIEENRVLRFQNPPAFLSYAAVGSKEEREGPFGHLFDHIDENGRFGKQSFEDAEGEMQRLCLSLALKKCSLSEADLSILAAGDLQNQCVASAGGLYTFGLPYFGLYGACSTCAQSLFFLSLYLSASKAKRGAAVTSSHNAVAERQFRLPLEYGGQRTPSAAWTATAAGAFILGDEGNVRIREGIVGRLIDGAITDASNMGAAMAPAAADSILSYLRDGSFSLSELDLIVTGDLGRIGTKLLYDLTSESGVNIENKHVDLGNLLYDKDSEDCHSGASGCGCSASLLAAHLLPKLERREMKRILFFSTGALMNTQSTLQKNNILGIAHGIIIEREN